MTFWDIVWFIVISFAFMAYLMMLFSIVGDIFRDRQSSGFVKAAWLVALVVLPFLTAFVYVIARGGGMAERAAASQPAWRREAQSNGAGSSTAADQIAQASAMLDKGTISQPEFDTLKAKALA